MIICNTWIKIGLPLRIGFEPFNDISFAIMLADIIIDILFGLNILIGFFVPLRTSEGKAILVTFLGDYVYDRKALC